MKWFYFEKQEMKWFYFEKQEMKWFYFDKQENQGPWLSASPFATWNQYNLTVNGYVAYVTYRQIAVYVYNLANRRKK